MRNHLPSTTAATALRHRLGRALRTAGIAGAVALGTLGLTAHDAAASNTELPVNELAPQITRSADRAVAAFDTFRHFGGAADYLRYERLRDETAQLAARQLGYDEAAMVEAWAEASTLHQQAVLAAMTQIGVPYRSNTSVEDEGFDCSGLTLFAWSEAGVELNRVSGDQIRSAEPVERDAAVAGDLVHFPGHVMMYLGVGNAVVHSVNTGRTVEIDTISERRAGSVRFGDPAT